MSELDLDELYGELEEFQSSKRNTSSRTPREERIIAGFEDIERFVEQNGRLPSHGEDKDIFERLYAVRLDKIRSSEECLSLLTDLDKHGILKGAAGETDSTLNNLSDDEMLAELGELASGNSDITKLTHVRTRAEVKAATEEIAQRSQCSDFENFRPLFVQVQEDLKSGTRESRRFKEDAQIRLGEFFIIGGQKAYVAEVGDEIRAPNGDPDARLRVIYDNGTESNLLRRSLQRALYKDDAGRRITETSAGPLFSDEMETNDLESGTIYVLRSKSDHPMIKENRDVIHKIGVTGNDVEKRVSVAKNDPTFLMADVEIVATYKLANINRVRLEALIHKFFSSARIDLQIQDRFGQPVTAREWFLVPLFVIDELVERIRNGTINDCYYDQKSAQIIC